MIHTATQRNRMEGLERQGALLSHAERQQRERAQQHVTRHRNDTHAQELRPEAVAQVCALSRTCEDSNTAWLALVRLYRWPHRALSRVRPPSHLRPWVAGALRRA